MKLTIAPEIEIIEITETDLEPLYRVIIHNDDVTPMDFVVEVLKQIFFLANDRAAEIMLTAHIKGTAYVQTLPRLEAEKRIQRAHHAAGMEGYPLHFSTERE
ncbi:MAG: ATP-dependent Clp protease adaptor ClpS [Chloroflexi bacterium]|nr:ATP-dependent Clp protease adaptor ClpS [Chloroflexota bacterium]